MGFLSYARVFTAAFVIGVFASRVSATAVPAETSLQTSRGEFTSQVVPDAKLRFVRNSGVCETTPGVEQLSGYLDVGTNMSMVRNQPRACSESALPRLAHMV